MNLKRLHTARAITARLVLLLALLLAGIVPDGMMRQAGPDGMRLVLCSSEGIKEVWLTEAGEVVPIKLGQSEPDQSDNTAHQPHCVQVNLITQAAAVPDPVPLEFRVGRIEQAQATHQIDIREVAEDARRTRARPSKA